MTGFTPSVDSLLVAAPPDAFRVRLENLRLPANVSAGCNPGVVMSLWHMLRGTTEDPPPVTVRQEADGTWRVVDGRHRLIAAVMAGRSDVLCTERHPTEAP